MRNEIHITIFKQQLYQYSDGFAAWRQQLRHVESHPTNLDDDIFIKNNLTPLTTSTTDGTETTHFLFKVPETNFKLDILGEWIPVVDFPLARLQIHVEEGAIVVEIHGAGTQVPGGGSLTQSWAKLIL